MNKFLKAERRQTALKIAITGPSGSGKTFSALLIASGIGKKIAVVDTENGSASLYAGMDKGPLVGVEFDTLPIEPPYTIPKYVEAINMAEKDGYDVLLIDGISPAWAGEGGLLEKKDALDQRGGNSYTNWASISKEHEKLKARLLTADIHLICTMRSKQDYVLELNAKGKNVPKKVGMAPIQRDGMEYEFTTVLDLGMDHNAIASKDRTSLFDGQIFKPTKLTGKKIMDWLREAKSIAKQAPAKTADLKDLEIDNPEPVKPMKVKSQEKPEQKSTVNQPSMIDLHNSMVRGIAVIEALGIGQTIESTWDAIHKEVKKKFNRDFAEASELSVEEAAGVVDYLRRWYRHVMDGRKAAAEKHAAEEPRTDDEYDGEGGAGEYGT